MLPKITSSFVSLFEKSKRKGKKNIAKLVQNDAACLRIVDVCSCIALLRGINGKRVAPTREMDARANALSIASGAISAKSASACQNY